MLHENKAVQIVDFHLKRANSCGCLPMVLSLTSSLNVFYREPIMHLCCIELVGFFLLKLASSEFFGKMSVAVCLYTRFEGTMFELIT